MLSVPDNHACDFERVEESERFLCIHELRHRQTIYTAFITSTAMSRPQAQALTQALRQTEITFDSQHQLHLLDPNVTKHTTELLSTSTEFKDKLSTFQSTVTQLSTILTTYGTLVETQRRKSYALGLKVENEQISRGQQQAQLKKSVESKKEELNSVQEELDALLRMEQEQKVTIERLQKV